MFAPFSPISEGESRILTVVSTSQDMEKQLEYAAQHIQSVQNVIKGASDSLLQYRRNNGQAVESYLLLVLACEIDTVPEETRRYIQMLMRRGPQYGVTFLIISPIIGSSPSSYLRSQGPNTQLIEPFKEKYRLSHEQEDPKIPYQVCTPAGITQWCAKAVGAAHKSSLPNVSFFEINKGNYNPIWNHSSADGITCPIGMYGLDPIEITLGDELNQRHNALITGAVGQGKSNLIQVIIHGLCMRYSPKELELYLLDFKEGVTFKPFAGTETGGWLPHARAIGLESDVAFGQAVLDHLHNEYKRRMRILKDHECTSINKLRRNNPDIVMPRILVIIDEFQLMFGEDADRARDIANTLERSVRLFRAAGIHFILASQSISGNIVLASVQDSLFAQIPIRIALKNSLVESMNTLGVNNPQAAFLRPHEAIVNLDYGAIAQNRRSVIAYADEDTLQKVRESFAKSRPDSKRPAIFQGDARIHAHELVGGTAQPTVPTVCLGKTISVDGAPLSIPLPAEPGRNICILGTPDDDCDTANGMLQAAALSLAMQLHGKPARFLFCDASNREQTYLESRPDFARTMAAIGCDMEAIEATSLENRLTGLADSPTGTPTYLFLSRMDSWRPAPQEPSYSMLSSSPSPLAALANQGPSSDIHIIGWWQQRSAFERQVKAPGSAEDTFNTTVLLRLGARDVQAAIGSFTAWTPQENRALAYDPITLGEATAFIPCAPANTEDATRLESMLNRKEA